MQELDSISTLFGFQIQHDEEPDVTVGTVYTCSILRSNDDVQRPYMLVSLPSEEAARQLGSRCILLKSISRYWTHGQLCGVISISLLTPLALDRPII